MRARELSVPGAWEFTPRQFADQRGAFLESFRHDLIAEHVGHPMRVRQGNTSISHRGVLRGIHFADVPEGQAKYVSVVSGSVVDFIIDLRVGSPHFGEWTSVQLDAVDRRSVYIAEGLGHAFLALEDNTTVTYLVTDTFKPDREHAVNPLDERIGLRFSIPAEDLIISEKDATAPTLDQALNAGVLPDWEVCRSWYSELHRHGSN